MSTSIGVMAKNLLSGKNCGNCWYFGEEVLEKEYCIRREDKVSKNSTCERWSPNNELSPKVSHHI